ncbi:Na(+)-translocating NADH-quinone reductase subunit C [Spirochaetota bacterium]|nr:Na(+)-translocating NADH-quinone reductase subunit C [Spirochaetota bacterium]
MANDRPSQTILVAFMLCIFCSLSVSLFAVMLRSAQDRNKLLDKQKNIIAVSGLSEKGDLANEEIEQLFESIKTFAIDLDTGEKIDDFNIETYNQKKVSKTPDLSIPLNDAEDIAAIGRRENISLVYEVYDANEELDAVVIPIRGYGLWSTLYGFLSLENDGTTVRGITFYDHAETPGLGGEVDNLKWKASWKGKQVFSTDDEIVITVVKGRASQANEVDGLAGATITTRGVDNMLQFWLGDKGYKKYIDKHLRNEQKT